MYRHAFLLVLLISCSNQRSEVEKRAAATIDTAPMRSISDTTDQRVCKLRDSVVIEKEDDGHRFRFAASQRVFDPERHDMSRIRDCLIDGERMYGTDCDPPRYELKNMTVEIDGKNLPIARSIYRQFFEPNLGYEDGTAYLDAYLSTDGEEVFVLMNGGDGAGAYGVVWCFRRDGRHSTMVEYDEVYFRFANGPA